MRVLFSEAMIDSLSATEEVGRYFRDPLGADQRNNKVFNKELV
jgi:hypothetical protein